MGKWLPRNTITCWAVEQRLPPLLAVNGSFRWPPHAGLCSAGLASVGFPKVHFTEEHRSDATCPVNLGARQGEIIVDFTADDIDSECVRIDGLGGDLVVLPTTHPWGRRSILFRDPQAHLVNVFS